MHVQLIVTGRQYVSRYANGVQLSEKLSLFDLLVSTSTIVTTINGMDVFSPYKRLFRI